MEKSREDRIMNISTMKEMKAVKHLDSDLSERWRWGTNFSKILRWGTARGTANGLFVWLITTRFNCFIFCLQHSCLPRTTINWSRWSQRLHRNWTNLQPAWTPQGCPCMLSALCHRHLPSRGYMWIPRIMTNVWETFNIFNAFFFKKVRNWTSELLKMPYQTLSGGENLNS